MTQCSRFERLVRDYVTMRNVVQSGNCVKRTRRFLVVSEEGHGLRLGADEWTIALVNEHLVVGVRSLLDFLAVHIRVISADCRCLFLALVLIHISVVNFRTPWEQNNSAISENFVKK